VDNSGYAKSRETWQKQASKANAYGFASVKRFIVIVIAEFVEST